MREGRGATGWHIRAVAAKKIKRTKRKMRENWKIKLWKWADENCGQRSGQR